MSLYRILVVDDAPEVRELLAAVLENPNWQLEFYSNGAEAIAACKRSVPDLVLSDISMPGKSGYEVCAWIKQYFIKEFVPVMLLTSLDNTRDKVSGLDCGADDYITKPFAVPELQARIRALLRTRSLTKQLQEARDLLATQEKQLLATSIVGGCAHELGQPLTSVMLNTRLLRSIPQDSSEFQEVLKSIEDQCSRMKDIIGELSKLESFETTDYVGKYQILDLSKKSD